MENNMAILPHEVVQPTKPHRYTIIVIHGDVPPGARLCRASLKDPRLCYGVALQESLPSIKWVFSIPSRATENRRRDSGSMQLTIEDRTQPWVPPAADCAKLWNLVNREAALLGSERKIFLGGYGKGATMAMNAIRYQERPLGGVFAFDDWITQTTQPAAQITRIGREVPGISIFLEHVYSISETDLDFRDELLNRLERANMDFVLKSYPYRGNPKAINDWASWIVLRMFQIDHERARMTFDVTTRPKQNKRSAVDENDQTGQKKICA